MYADGELMHRANPSALVSKLDEDMGRGSGAYRPPKLASVSMHAPSGGGGRMHADSDDDLLAQAAGTATTDNVELSGTSLSLGTYVALGVRGETYRGISDRQLSCWADRLVLGWCKSVVVR